MKQNSPCTEVYRSIDTPKNTCRHLKNRKTRIHEKKTLQTEFPNDDEFANQSKTKLILDYSKTRGELGKALSTHIKTDAILGYFCRYIHVRMQ